MATEKTKLEAKLEAEETSMNDLLNEIIGLLEIIAKK